MQPLTNKNIVGWTFTKLINMMNEDLFKNIETDELITIECIGGDSKIHKSMLMYFSYFNSLFSNNWKNEPIKLKYKVECMEYFKKMLYRLEYIELLSEIDNINLLEFLDYINSPNIFINKVVGDIINTNNVDNLCDFIKDIKIKLPKKSKTMLFNKITKYECNNKYINTLSKYLPEFTSKIIEYKTSQLNYVEILLKDDFNIDKIPKKYSKNIIKYQYVIKYISDIGEYEFIFIHFKNYYKCLNYYNYHIKHFNQYSIRINIIKNE